VCPDSHETKIPDGTEFITELSRDPPTADPASYNWNINLPVEETIRCYHKDCKSLVRYKGTFVSYLKRAYTLEATELWGGRILMKKTLLILFEKNGYGDDQGLGNGEEIDYSELYGKKRCGLSSWKTCLRDRTRRRVNGPRSNFTPCVIQGVAARTTGTATASTGTATEGGVAERSIEY